VNVVTDVVIELDDDAGTVVAHEVEAEEQTQPYVGASLRRRLQVCTACPCRLEARQVVVGIGPATARVLFLGQNPGEDEDEAGVPFIGRAGLELETWLPILGLTRAQIAISNVVKCHTTKNRAPRPAEVLACRDLWLGEELAALPQVQLIVPLGKPATEAVLGSGAPAALPKALYWRRAVWHDRPVGVFPLPHPAYLLRMRGQRAPFLTTILPKVAECWRAEWPDVYGA
jgi:uracil-DNA glycosylase family 4